MENNIKKNACMCITKSLCCVAEINTALEINYNSIKSNKFYIEKQNKGKGSHDFSVTFLLS